jgi:hypothetical protein
VFIYLFVVVVVVEEKRVKGNQKKKKRQQANKISIYKEKFGTPKRSSCVWKRRKEGRKEGRNERKQLKTH